AARTEPRIRSRTTSPTRNSRCGQSAGLGSVGRGTATINHSIEGQPGPALAAFGQAGDGSRPLTRTEDPERRTRKPSLDEDQHCCAMKCYEQPGIAPELPPPWAAASCNRPHNVLSATSH